MDAWPFVVAAYAVGLGATASLLLASAARMRAAERRADALRRR